MLEAGLLSVRPWGDPPSAQLPTAALLTTMVRTWRVFPARPASGSGSLGPPTRTPGPQTLPLFPTKVINFVFKPTLSRKKPFIITYDFVISHRCYKVSTYSLNTRPLPSPSWGPPARRPRGSKNQPGGRDWPTPAQWGGADASCSTCPALAPSSHRAPP